MINETQEMRQARYALQELSASDPAASSNMMRYATAYAIMVTGRRGTERRQHEPQIASGFVLTHGDEQLCAAAAHRSGTDYLYIAFNVDDAAVPPVAAGVFQRQGADIVAYASCRLDTATPYSQSL